MKEKKLLFVMLFMMGYLYTNAQHLLVTNSGDSLFCKEIRTSRRGSDISYYKDGRLINTFIPKEEIKNVRRDYYTKHGEIAEPKRDFTVYNRDTLQLPVNQIRFSFATAARINNVDQEVDYPLNGYLGQLNSGLNISAGYSHFLTRRFGMGLGISYFFRSINSGDFQDFMGRNLDYYREDFLSIFTISQTQHFRIPLKREGHILSPDVSINFDSFTWRTTSSLYNLERKVNALSVGFGADYVIFIPDSSYGIVFGLATSIGWIDDVQQHKDINPDAGPEFSREGTSRIVASFGFTF
ncbi:hypothetical protein QWY31_15850 [Cytophagales bacterium LB-30]|uniref:Outer membrane protein beta-barrel domain-containing protein n=1 Tax=Shiella aurantiaca TaxID=3058365 RepID=A0ABT8F9B2_9BACT|nr:hypothetical protein [Shiella aurantiaca]MDN4166985.1 hypothetical protein [Shiella aurantiaca]